MRTLYRALCVALSLVTPVAANADVFCSFTISSLWVTPDGWVNLALGGSGYGKNWWLCPVSGSIAVNDGYGSKTITSDTCKTIYSQILTQKITGHPLKIQFHGPADCSAAALPADGVAPTPYPANFGFIE